MKCPKSKDGKHMVACGESGGERYCFFCGIPYRLGWNEQFVDYEQQVSFAGIIISVEHPTKEKEVTEGLFKGQKCDALVGRFDVAKIEEALMCHQGVKSWILSPGAAGIYTVTCVCNEPMKANAEELKAFVTKTFFENYVSEEDSK